MKLTPSALTYTLENLMEIAFPELPHTIELGKNDALVTLLGDIQLRFMLMDSEQNENLLSGTLRLSTLHTSWGHAVPIYHFYASENFYTIDNREVTFLCDLVTIPFMMLSRYEESLTDKTDIHDRYQFENSLAARYDFIDYPIVDEYALMIRHWAKSLFPQLPVNERKGQLIATHDIDIISRFGHLIKNIRTILGGDLLNRRSWTMAKKSFRQYHDYRGDKNKDPYIVAIEMFLKLSLNAQVSSKFFFKGLVDNEYDATYNIYHPEAKYIITKIEEAGMEVGLHGGYRSYDDTATFGMEKSRLEEVCGHAIHSQRQHFLRFDIRKTIRVWEESDIKHDYTLGYAEREGFRCGTAHPYKLYDIVNDRPTQIVEHPLIAMDGTFFQYRKIDCQEALEKIRELYETCLQTEGDFVILWHNTTVFREYENWYQEVFRRLMESIH
ncbi:MAG TPA: polysaccharide deacetylase family protein [Bacteroidales bacterium]|jgi:hypothetical protein|nr:polysaccharide deacetylase family protein [Bacteroidales bacterium]MDD4395178.1 polysaccharide deacetylase family protein [Bacteroidales bacterium]HNW67928.1 polysaccharide deacetylase family protein [Bacteroidales bacterium]HPT52252.1 polysaccharide deacetylase family protein [Bacteroidales bacterium]